MDCPKCGREFGAGDNFCRSCGAPKQQTTLRPPLPGWELPIPPDPVPITSPPPPPGWELPLRPEQVQIPSGDRPSYELMWNELADREGRGCGFTMVRMEDRQPLRASGIPVGKTGTRVFQLAGARHRPDAIAADAFKPGLEVTLKPEPDNPHDPDAIAVWDKPGEITAGYVPRTAAQKTLLRELGTPKAPRVFVMWEHFEGGGPRTGARLIAVYPDAPIFVSGKRFRSKPSPSSARATRSTRTARMGLKPCRECGKDVSSEARTCPHCGATYPAGNPAGVACLGCMVIFAVVLFMVLLLGA